MILSTSFIIPSRNFTKRPKKLHILISIYYRNCIMSLLFFFNSGIPNIFFKELLNGEWNKVCAFFISISHMWKIYNSQMSQSSVSYMQVHSMIKIMQKALSIVKRFIFVLYTLTLFQFIFNYFFPGVIYLLIR